MMNYFSPFYDALVTTLETIDYVEHHCSECESIFFSHSTLNSGTCNDCQVIEPISIRSASEPLTVNEVMSKLVDFVTSQPDLILEQPRSILNVRHEPLFITAGIQVIDPVIHHEAETTAETLVVAQPSVRLNFLDQTDVQRASYTSFVNTAFAHTESDTETHVANLNVFLSFLGSVGIDSSRLTLRFRENQNNWGEGVFDSKILDLTYNGVGIGDAVLLQNYPQTSRSPLTISDISFGVERILLAINNHSVERDMFGDHSVRSGIFLDLVKTSSLLIGSEVYPSSSNNPGRKLRDVIRRIAQSPEQHTDQAFMNDTFEMYWNWWKQFTPISIKSDDICEVVQEEIHSIVHSSKKGKTHRKKVSELRATPTS